ncbi:MAG: MarR family transcriptional regulator [Oscillospiraceae bacterium]|nr:MarR family transcriptional regulator [Oscillospiraceae bacterium]
MACFHEMPEHFGALMGYCHHQVHKLMGKLLRQYDVSPMQCRTLTYLHRQTEPVNQKTLERFLMVKPSTVNGIVDRLEEKGLVVRRAGAQDGRCRILTLTEQGMRFYDDFTAVIGEVDRRLEQGFTAEERKLLTGFLLRVAQNLQQEDEA